MHAGARSEMRSRQVTLGGLALALTTIPDRIIAATAFLHITASAVDRHVVQRTVLASLRAIWARQGHPQKESIWGVSRSLCRTAGMNSVRMPGRVPTGWLSA